MKTTFNWIATHAMRARNDDRKNRNISYTQTAKQSKILGQSAEQFIARTLEQEGYRVCARNYQRSFGEIDIIAQKGDTVAFVEVKFRQNPLFDVGTIITRSKQKKMIAVAKYFMAAHNLDNHAIRFDVAFVSGSNGDYSTHYIASAFHE